MTERVAPTQGKLGGDGGSGDSIKLSGTPPSNRSSLDGSGGSNGSGARNGSPVIQAGTPVLTTAAAAGSGGPVPHPIVKIGHYVLGETLGVGTFGKVKSRKREFETGKWFHKWNVIERLLTFC